MQPTHDRRGFETEARRIKANKLSDALIDAGCTAALARQMSPFEWKLVAQRIGVNAPSATTVAEVVDRLAAHERPAITQPADVFAGL